MTTGRIKTSLLSLPDELLSTIISEAVRVHGRRTATLASTCRRLAPIVRQEVYRELLIGNNEAQSDVLVDAAVLLPSIRTSRIKYLRISVNAAFTDEIMRSLVDGPTRMKHLKVLQLDYTCGFDPWAKRDLVLAHLRETQFDLARVKATLSPKWPPGCSPEGLRTVMDAARQTGITGRRSIASIGATASTN
ncbi:hypothetical protein RHOSPDRAFT_34123 [Rhodotorula sp. JG-1b]|nr:hypothetical protein RHOSPDRAFT_34123 [Rhodotorula sp. JG-1b]